MLVLTRRVGERVVVGEEIEITVVSVRGDQVRLGIAAPREVSIYRAEVAEAVRRENAAAARAAEVVHRAKEGQKVVGRRAQAVRSGCR